MKNTHTEREQIENNLYAENCIVNRSKCLRIISEFIPKDVELQEQRKRKKLHPNLHTTKKGNHMLHFPRFSLFISIQNKMIIKQIS